MNWYVLNVFNGKEKKVKENIEKELEDQKVSHLVANILIPKEKYFQLRRGKKVKVERNYMPGYIMVECDMNREVLSAINHANGVVKFLGSDINRPEPMKDKEVERILMKFDELHKSSEIFEHNFIVGQKVEIIDGPFTSMFGTITNILDEKKRINVDVNIFSRKTPVELGFDQVAEC